MRAVRGLSLIGGIWLVLNLFAMPLWWGGYSASEGSRGVVQLVILVGFAYVLLFDLLSIVYFLTRTCWIRGDAVEEGCQKGWLVVLAVLALVGLMGVKVMVDEIARETPLGRGGGEWVVLYICLGLQLAYLAAAAFHRPGSTPSTED